MDGDGSYQTMLGSLRNTLTEKIPGGLSEQADRRLQKSLNHYVKEVIRVEGCLEERDVLRLTYDSMVSWFRRNTQYLSPRSFGSISSSGASAFSATTVNPDLMPGGLARSGEMILETTAAPLSAANVQEVEDDPIAILERMRALRDAERFKQTPSPVRTMDLPTAPPPVVLPAGQLALQPKDFVQRQEDVVKYREVENNLVLNSKDRDWLRNTTENRYNFSIQFNSLFRPQGTGAQPTVQNRLRNIVRVEFVKAILPVEGLDVVVPRDCAAEGETKPEVPDAAFYSVLGLPFITVNLDEFQGNNYGTNNSVDEALAICQYDATWKSDQVSSTTDYNRGYTLFFPKFMKAQRVYAPTPLANFQTLSFQLLNPENAPLSTLPDASPIANIIFSANTDGSCYSDGAQTTPPTAPKKASISSFKRRNGFRCGHSANWTASSSLASSIILLRATLFRIRPVRHSLIGFNLRRGTLLLV